MNKVETYRNVSRGAGRMALGWGLLMQGVLGALTATPALAQGTEASAEDTIIVTAQRRAERLEDVPAAIQTIGGER